MDYFSNMSNGKLLAICFIVFACTLILPRLIRMEKIQRKIHLKHKKNETITPQDLSGKQKLFYTHNGTSHEIEQLLIKLKSYASKRGMKIIYPGSFKYCGAVSPTTMILAGKFGLLLIRCYGFGGHIYTEGQEGQPVRWMQHMNDTLKEILNPQESMEQEKYLMIQALKNSPFQNTCIYTASVFTRPNIILSVPRDSRVFNRGEFMEWLQKEKCFTTDTQLEIKKIVDYLMGMITQT